MRLASCRPESPSRTGRPSHPPVPRSVPIRTGVQTRSRAVPVDPGLPSIRFFVMSVLEFLMLLVVAGVCGSIGQALGGFGRGGCLVSIALGFIGALLGLWLKKLLDLPEMLPITIGGRPFPVIWSIIGSALFVAILGLISRRRR